MEKLCKTSFKLLIAVTLLAGGPAWSNTPAAQTPVAQQLQQPRSPKEVAEIAEMMGKACDKDRPDYKASECAGWNMQFGNGASAGSCSDDIAKSSAKGIEDALNEAEKSCAGLADEESSVEASENIRSCSRMIDDCAKLQGAVNAMDPEETKSEEHTDALTQFANNNYLQQMGIQIPTQKKADPLADEEKEYYKKCPIMSEDSWNTQLKALEDKKDKLKEDIVKKKKEIVEAMSKANKDMEEYNKKKAERAERGRKDKADNEKEIQRINSDFNKQASELAKVEAETIKSRNTVDATYNAFEKKRAKLAVDLSGISVELSGACKGKYHEMLAKVPMSNRRVMGAAAAVESRDYKLAFMKRCVRDQWFEVKEQYDKIKAELNSLKSEKDNARKQLAAIKNEKDNMVAMKARQDQSVAQGEQDRIAAAAQLEQEMIQSAQRGIQQNQQTSMNLQADITNIEAAEAKIDKRIAQLGKKPSGKMTLVEAKAAIGVLKNRTESAKAVIDSTQDPNCKTLLTTLTDKARAATSAGYRGRASTGEDKVPGNSADGLE